MEGIADKIANDLDAADLPYSMRLIRLVDEESTYRLRIGEETLEFSNTDDAYDYVREARLKAKAAVVMAAIAQARREALEEAARIAEGVTAPPVWGGPDSIIYEAGTREAAAAIRALIEKEW